jgi:hypothetical protein
VKKIARASSDIEENIWKSLSLSSPIARANGMLFVLLIHFFFHFNSYSKRERSVKTAAGRARAKH